jgi:hypothetical protein
MRFEPEALCKLIDARTDALVRQMEKMGLQDQVLPGDLAVFGSSRVSTPSTSLISISFSSRSGGSLVMSYSVLLGDVDRWRHGNVRGTRIRHIQIEDGPRKGREPWAAETIEQVIDLAPHPLLSIVSH